jgi:ABC-type nitrate/sulfonate/bicarbonate transport system permease component
MIFKRPGGFSASSWTAAAFLPLLLALWQLASAVVPVYILPPPADVLDRLWMEILERDIWIDSLITMRTLLAGFVLSLAGGVTLGVLAFNFPVVEKIMHPTTVFIESAPTIAWLVLAILWLGLGSGPPVLVGVSMALPLFYLNTITSLQQLERGYFEMAQVYDLSRWKKLTSLILPSLAISLVGTASGALSVAWRGIIMAEAFSSSDGLGPLLWGEYLYGNINKVYALILWIVALGLGMEYLLIHPLRRIVTRRLGGD